MKKEKSKSADKKSKKELEDKLTNAFNAVVAEYGKAKKTKSIIEKFAKQLSKKVDLKSKTAIETAVTEPVTTPSAKPKVVKAKPIKKFAETTK